MTKPNFEWWTACKEKVRRKLRAACYWKRNRCGTKFNNDLRGKIAEKAGIGADELLLMMIDDSPFRTRDKNVVLTDRRILYQTVKGGRYTSIDTASLKGASVFAERAGGKTVLCVVNADGGNSALQAINILATVLAEIHLKYFRSPDTLRMIFHDYLSKYCPGYMPFNEDNYQYYKKVVSPMLHKTPAAAVVASITGIVSLGMLAMFDILYTVKQTTGAISQIIVDTLLMAALLAWSVNVIIPGTKSKMSKLLLLMCFAARCCLLDYYKYLPDIHREWGSIFLALPNQVLFTAKVCIALLWLLFDNVNFDKLTRIVIAALAAMSVLLALMGLTAGIRAAL